jgi:nucleoside-triphosphatase THEP1
MKYPDDKWIKASVAGSLWAASEIVAGSFLHNLKIPFSGNILATVGLILLISLNQVWREKGLFWRAGIICALMKTMSPGAVIFGPMIAIAAQGFLLETSTRLLGRNLMGYVLGGIMVMSWNLLQKIVNLIVVYGVDIVRLYSDLTMFSRVKLGINEDIFWLPLTILLLLYAVWGAVAALAGIRIGNGITGEELSSDLQKPVETKHNPTGPDFPHSMLWLIVNMILLVLVLISLGSEWQIWGTLVIVVTFIWSLRYKKVIRKMANLRFWILFVIITMSVAFLFSEMRGESTTTALIAGLRMNFRAVAVIAGFSVIGTELYNPRIRKFFYGTMFRQLPGALELSFASLPAMIAGIPDAKSFIKNPATVMRKMVNHAENRLHQIKGELKKPVFIITGAVGAGKTSTVKHLAEKLALNGIKFSGLWAEKTGTVEETTGYMLVDAVSREKRLFLDKSEGNDKIGCFTLCADTLEWGRSLLLKALQSDNEVVIIDEAGLYEIEQNNGWHTFIEQFAQSRKHHPVITVREQFLDKLKEKYFPENTEVFNVTDGPEKIAEEIIQKLRRTGKGDFRN